MALLKTAHCAHVPGEQAAPRGDACPGCGSTRSLRMCTSCGHVACCESQFGHNTEHWRKTGHAVIRPYPLSERGWAWCYACDRYL